MILAILASYKTREAIYYLCLTESAAPQLSAALNRADAQRERNRERERAVCAHAGSGQQDLALTRQYRLFSETAFLKGGKVIKQSVMLLSWQHCASSFLQLRVGPQVRQKIHAALIAR